MKTCHVCAGDWLVHIPGCRVLADLERMGRVFIRLSGEGREPALRDRMAAYLDEFGRLPCQSVAGLPDGQRCVTCEHKDVCVLIPGAVTS